MMNLTFEPDSLKHLNLHRKKLRKSDYEAQPEPHLTPTYGIRAFHPGATCADIHPYGPIPKYSKIYCECCSTTGIENHPSFRRDAMDRNGSRQWPDLDASRVHDPGELAGGKGKANAKVARPTVRDREWLAAYRGGVQLDVLATAAASSLDDVTAGMKRAIYEEQAAIIAEAKRAIDEAKKAELTC